VRVLITGGNGLLGRHLVPALEERGDSVRVLALPGEDTSWLHERGVEVLRGDIRAPETLVRPMRGVENVLHLAGMMGAWRPMEDYRAVNVAGTLNVCRAAMAEGIRRLVHVSSWTVYGLAVGRSADETFPLAPFADPYPVTKAEGDLLVQRMVADENLPAVIIRPDTFFGPGDQLHFGRMADRLARERGVIIGPGRNALPFVYVTDVARGLLLALDRGTPGQAYNIASDRPLTQQQFLEAIAREIGAGPPRIHVPYAALYAAAFAGERLATMRRSAHPPLVTRLGVKLFGTENVHAIDKARRELGYEPLTPLEEGIRLSAAWYRAEATRAPLSGAMAVP
jgi:nucleoside-diphosphate-sugar epimerase